MAHNNNPPQDDDVFLFVEAQPWEREALAAGAGRQYIARMDARELQDIPDAELPDNVAVLSTFVHSRVDQQQLDRLEHLRFIAARSTGYDHIDVEACSHRGILVANVPVYGENTVAEHTFALLLALTRKIHLANERTVRGDFSLEGLQGSELNGKTFGCLGTGHIGRKALAISRGFGMRALAYDLRPDKDAARRGGYEYVDLPTLLAESDVVSVHLPYNRATHHLIDRPAFARMRPGAILINTARGSIIDSGAMLDALRSGRLGAAGLDVLEGESEIDEEAELLSSQYDVEALRTFVKNHALLRMPNVIVTPHTAFNSREALQRIVATTLQNIQAFLAGTPQNIVNQQLVKV